MVKLIGKNKINTSVFISGRGSNLKNLFKFSKQKQSPIKISLVLSSSKMAKGLKFAKSNNIKRIIPDGLGAKIELNKIKTNSIFKWIKNQGVSDKEMIKTFNCGVGFCLIINSKNLKKINKYFSKNFKPYEIGKIINGKKNVKLNGRINWEK